MAMNWWILGGLVVDLLAPVLITLIIVVAGFRKFIAPEFAMMVETSSNLAKLAQIKSTDSQDYSRLRDAVIEDVMDNDEVMQVINMFSPETGEMLKANPIGAARLLKELEPVLQKFGIGTKGAAEREKFDF